MSWLGTKWAELRSMPFTVVAAAYERAPIDSRREALALRVIWKMLGGAG